ncbi:hypothetical protein A3Q56_03647 [Intoshia linei]|uniref:Band 3 cytoplasmic domain-containing protein n=1 Tax=Intoshia linei TaxID=1819745 RepID=A0A177B343_9BILA|nr:hypothetical protein A3Q56_03647 [Intoshia linei]
MASNVVALLLSKHRHQYQNEKLNSQINIPFVRLIVDIPRNTKNAHKRSREKSSNFLLNNIIHSESYIKNNQHILKKIPDDAEAANILVGIVNFLEAPFHAFVRLAKGTQMSDLTEVSVPTRFFYLLLGPDDRCRCYHKTGRAISTFMSDDVFHDIAYKATNKNNIMVRIDEFLDQCTVLPPGEYDPNIRIELPSKVPDQKGRKDYSSNLLGNGSSASDGEIKDNTLKSTHRIFCG